MKKIYFFLLLSILLPLAPCPLSLPAFCATVARYSGSRIFWDARQPAVIFSGAGYARLIELQDGRLLACSESGGIKINFSMNKGRTWGTPTVIAPNPTGLPNCVPDLVQLADGTILVAYNPRPIAPYSDERRFGIKLRRSTDRGRTWSEEITVYDAGSDAGIGCWEPSFLELPSGELQLYFADESPYPDNNDQQISLCRSFDGGQTWTEPQRISYRSGHRDGMPVPVLLADSRTIVVAIEDNGWPQTGDFLPTTVRTTLSNNWRNNSYVSASSSLRNCCINYDYCPLAPGGAPYLRVMPNGETILTHQTSYGGNAENKKMYVYVGNKQAKDFKAMSRPFYQDDTKDCRWNSLAVIDTGVVVAVGGLSGKITMTKGYLKNQFLVPYGTPEVDGRFNKQDTYYDSSAKQVPMGAETGTYSYSDFAYDDTCLYMTCMVYRRQARSAEPFPDGVNFYIESIGASTNVPAKTAYRLEILPNGEFKASKGNGKTWEATSLPDVRVVGIVGLSSYRIEVAVPWQEMGLAKAPTDKKVSVNLEVLTGDGEQQLTERIADANPDKPFTWMPLNLLEPDPTGINSLLPSSKTPQPENVYDLQGRKVNGQLRHGLYVINGRKTIVK